MNIQPLVADLPSVCDCQPKPKKILTSAPHKYGGSQSQIQSHPLAPPEPNHMKLALCCPCVFHLGVFAFARLSSTTAHQQQEAQRQSSGETGQAQVQPVHAQPASAQPPGSKCSLLFTSIGYTLRVDIC